MINTVNEYNNYIARLPKLINDTYYKAEFFVNALNISLLTYYRKLRKNDFNTNEVTILTKLLFPKEAFKQELLKNIEKGRSDINEKRTMSSNEVRTAMRKKIEAYQ